VLGKTIVRANLSSRGAERDGLLLLKAGNSHDWFIPLIRGVRKLKGCAQYSASIFGTKNNASAKPLFHNNSWGRMADDVRTNITTYPASGLP
jgi:hypothetical protein